MFSFIFFALGEATVRIMRMLRWHEDYAGLVILAILIVVGMSVFITGAVLLSE